MVAAGTLLPDVGARARLARRLLADALAGLPRFGSASVNAERPRVSGGTEFGKVAAGLAAGPTDPATDAGFAAALSNAAETLAEGEAQLALLAKATGDTVWRWDLATDLVACTHNGTNILGGDTEKFVQPFGWWQERVHPDDRAALEEAARAIRTGERERWAAEYRFLHADGTYRWVWDRGIVLAGATGRPAAMFGCMTDISSRKETEEMLQHVERRQHALIAAVSNIVWRDDVNAATQPRNFAWEEYTGQTAEQEFGQGWLDVIHPDDRETALAAWSSAMEKGSVYQVDIRLRRHDGVYRWMSARGAPVRDRSGRIVEWIGLYEDIDDHYAAREALRQRTEELGERVKEMRCLHAVMVACNRDEASLAQIFSDLALVLPGAVTRPALAVCRIECAGAVVRSAAYVEPVQVLTAALEIDGAAVGAITLGYTEPPGEVVFIPEEEQLLNTAAHILAQAVARRRTRKRLQQQSQELWRRQAMFEQTEQLGEVGGWEFDVANGVITWSKQARRIAASYPDSPSHGTGAPHAFLQGPIETALKSRQGFDLEIAWPLPDGTTKWVRTLGQLEMAAGAPVRVFGIVKDVTEEKEARHQIWRAANHDALTGLPNRRLFGSKLGTALSRAEGGTALLLIDLDRFKEVNDTLGHDIGDALLGIVAQRLVEAAGEGAKVARLGGDEFGVLAPVGTLEEAGRLAERVVAGFREPVLLAGRTSYVGFSAGLAVSPFHATSPTELLKCADIALYVGKSTARSTVVTYRPEMRAGMERRLALRAEIRESLEQNRFVPFYQPKISLKDNAVTGFEALLRWEHPSGLRGPAAVLPAFEDHALAQAIFKRMLDRVVADIVTWRRAGLGFGTIALNASPAEFAGFDLAGCVLDRLASAGLPASSLAIEVTESVLMEREDAAIAPTLRRLCEAGVSLALDDFGTGYASLTHLQHVPVDTIKIDKSFIASIGQDAGGEAITSAVIGLGRNFGLTVVAEGVETREQAEALRAAGCDQAQGFLFARPMPAERIPGFLRNWSAGSGTVEARRSRSAA